VWDALVAAIAPLDGLICGLGARDTLRTEMGYPLHGHELSLDISPVEASASWAVGWNKETFIGSEVLLSQKNGSSERKSVAIKSLDRGIPRAGMSVKNSRGNVIGVVTSGTFSPTLKKGIALALINPHLQVGDSLIIDVRGRDCVSVIVDLPMVQSHVR
jgi:aminomethyltransferase